jgi:ribonuclease P protein component
LGLSVGRRFGGAAQRNRFKRICREAFRLTKDKQPMGWDWIILPAKPIAAGALGGSQWTLDSVRADMLRQMGRVAGRKSARTPRRASEPPRAHERDDRDRR